MRSKTDLKFVAPWMFLLCSFLASPAWAQPENGDGAEPPAKTEAETEPEEKDESPFPQRFDAPSLESGHDWLNTDRPLDWRDLRGKVVLLDFWTYCCINCMHVLPDLEYLEQKYPKELVVIGVHSAKFENEKDTDAIRAAIQRYEIKHPVINDADMVVWRKFQANSWPTLVIVDPEGKYIGYISGEGHRSLLDGVVQKLIDYHKEKGTLNEEPLNFALESSKLKPTSLKFPGKVLVSEERQQVFVSDSNHNRIVISTLSGELVEVVGNGKIGLHDGAYSEAQFDHPQGMTLQGSKLYVADTENHAIRVIDLDSKTVSTLAGTGQQARTRSTSGQIDQMDLNSPWALTIVGEDLYIAMAGPHQLWVHRLGSDELKLYAGSGREDILDGTLLESRLAQPSGIIHDESGLYFVDSEGSAVRKVDFETSTVQTLAGPRDLPRGRSLFEFGDTDGAGEVARFQHPLGIAIHQKTLYVADSYNQKIRTVSLESGEVSTLLGTGEAGSQLKPEVELSEPGGLAFGDNKLWIADTNNHRILTVDLKSNKVNEFTIQGLQPPAQ